MQHPQGEILQEPIMIQFEGGLKWRVKHWIVIGSNSRDEAWRHDNFTAKCKQSRIDEKIEKMW